MVETVLLIRPPVHKFMTIVYDVTELTMTQIIGRILKKDFPGDTGFAEEIFIEAI